jgi:hypothetical protein
LAIQVVNQRAADDASYWMGVCQFDQNRYRVAAETFTKYLKAHREGAWVAPAQYYLALCHAARHDYPAAIAALEEISSGHPEQAGHAVLIRHWQALAAGDRKEPEGKGSPTGVHEPPAPQESRSKEAEGTKSAEAD